MREKDIDGFTVDHGDRGVWINSKPLRASLLTLVVVGSSLLETTYAQDYDWKYLAKEGRQQCITRLNIFAQRYHERGGNINRYDAGIDLVAGPVEGVLVQVWQTEEDEDLIRAVDREGGVIPARRAPTAQGVTGADGRVTLPSQGNIESECNAVLPNGTIGQAMDALAVIRTDSEGRSVVERLGHPFFASDEIFVENRTARSFNVFLPAGLPDAVALPTSVQTATSTSTRTATVLPILTPSSLPTSTRTQVPNVTGTPLAAATFNAEAPTSVAVGLTPVSTSDITRTPTPTPTALISAETRRNDNTWMFIPAAVAAAVAVVVIGVSRRRRSPGIVP